MDFKYKYTCIPQKPPHNPHCVFTTYPFVIQDNPPAADDDTRNAMTRHSLEYVEVTQMVMCLGGDGPRLYGVPENYVGVGANSDPALSTTSWKTVVRSGKHDTLRHYIFTSIANYTLRIHILVQYMARRTMYNYNVLGTLGMNRIILQHKFGVPRENGVLICQCMAFEEDIHRANLIGELVLVRDGQLRLPLSPIRSPHID